MEKVAFTICGCTVARVSSTSLANKFLSKKGQLLFVGTFFPETVVPLQALVCCDSPARTDGWSSSTLAAWFHGFGFVFHHSMHNMQCFPPCVVVVVWARRITPTGSHVLGHFRRPKASSVLATPPRAGVSGHPPRAPGPFVQLVVTLPEGMLPIPEGEAPTFQVLLGRSPEGRSQQWCPFVPSFVCPLVYVSMYAPK